MLQPKKSTASKKVVKKVNPADSYPANKDKRGVPTIGGGEGTRPPFKSGGKITKAKNGKSFDLNGDGKTTFKDVLIGRGVLPKTAKSGAKLKKQAATAIAMKKAGKTPKAIMKSGGSMKTCRYGCK